MKTVITTILFSVLFLNINAQEIQATTSAGKKVILNVDDKSWRWANESDGEKPCITDHRAKIYIHNNTSQDIYFYYTNKTLFYWEDKFEYIKIKAGEHRLVDDLYTKSGQHWENINNYKWKVAYELYDITTNTKMSDFKGFDTGTFFLTECETKDIKIYD